MSEDKCPYCGSAGREIKTISGAETIEYKCGVRNGSIKIRSPKCYETELTALKRLVREILKAEGCDDFIKMEEILNRPEVKEIMKAE